MTPATGLLEKIAARRRVTLSRLPTRSLEERREPLNVSENTFLSALEKRRGSAVIAEVKVRSPRTGHFPAADLPVRQARAYAEAGAAALSVVVEPEFFRGSYGLLEECRVASGLPALAKDFVVSSVQLEWAREAGADAVLLIARLQEPEDLARLARQARALGLAPLIEIHARQKITDLMKEQGEAWELVGVNNRDLRTFAVDLAHSIDVVADLPRSALKVAESGIAQRDEVRRLARGGFDAFLVGEALLRAKDPGRKLRELLGDREGAGE